MTARILAARRTAVVPRGGAFAGLRIEDLAAPVIAAVLADAGLAVADVDEVICSNALGAGGNPARRVALAAGLPDRVAGLSIDRQCAGGLDAIGLAAALVESGRCRVVLAGGVESYSQRPLRARLGPGGVEVPYDQAPFTPWHDRDPDMTQAAAALAAMLNLTRDEMDAFAVASHARSLAQDFGAEIVVLADQRRDAFARRLTPAVAARAPVLAGPVTAANTAVAADAAAFVVVAASGQGPRIVAQVTLGADPCQPGLAPIPAIAAALARADVAVTDLSVAEIMEAYAAQAMACIRGAGLNPTIVNARGGALARGHPIGASGAILAVRLVHDLTQGHGLAAIASAGGIGAALVLAAD